MKVSYKGFLWGNFELLSYLLGIVQHLAAADLFAAVRFAISLAAGTALNLILWIRHKVGVIFGVSIGIAVQYLTDGQVLFLHIVLFPWTLRDALIGLHKLLEV